jgi:hypothetical protein
MDATTGTTSLEMFVQTMTERMARLARSLGAWVQEEPRSLQQQEELLRQAEARLADATSTSAA